MQPLAGAGIPEKTHTNQTNDTVWVRRDHAFVLNYLLGYLLFFVINCSILDF